MDTGNTGRGGDPGQGVSDSNPRPRWSGVSVSLSTTGDPLPPDGGPLPNDLRSQLRAIWSELPHDGPYVDLIDANWWAFQEGLVWKHIWGMGWRKFCQGRVIPDLRLYMVWVDDCELPMLMQFREEPTQPAVHGAPRRVRGAVVEPGMDLQDYDRM